MVTRISKHEDECLRHLTEKVLGWVDQANKMDIKGKFKVSTWITFDANMSPSSKCHLALYQEPRPDRKEDSLFYDAIPFGNEVNDLSIVKACVLLENALIREVFGFYLIKMSLASDVERSVVRALSEKSKDYDLR